MVEYNGGEGELSCRWPRKLRLIDRDCEQDVAATYEKVTGHLATALSKPVASENNLPPVAHTMLDLLIILLPYLPSTAAQALFGAAATGNLIENSDPAIQKKSYRILTRLIELKKATGLQGEAVDAFVQKLVDASGNIGAGAQRVSRNSVFVADADT